MPHKLVFGAIFAFTALASANSTTAERLAYEQKYTARGYAGPYDIDPYPRLPGDIYSNSYLRHPVPLADEFSFEKLTELIRAKNLTKIEDVIRELPDNMKQDNYVLMYRSRSLQEASPEAPRAILYTPTASFILSFNGGNPGTAGARTLETIQFRYDEKRFEFREFEFDGTNLPRISSANPAKCIECHQSPSRVGVDLRPNWEPYATWIGAFGSDDGQFSSRPLREKPGAVFLPQDEPALAEQANEFDFFKRYVDEIAPAHPRYSQLGHVNLHAPVDLTEHLAVWNGQRVVRLMMQESTIFPLYREMLASWTMCPWPSTATSPSPALRWHRSFEFPQYKSSPTTDRDSLSEFITQTFEPLGVDTSDWSVDFQTGGRMAFIERFGTPSYPKNSFRWAWVHTVPGAGDLTYENCAKLVDTGIRKLDAAFADGTIESIRTSRAAPAPTAAGVLQRCARCHASGIPSIPAIPFNNPELLRRELDRPTRRQARLVDEIESRTSDMALQKDQMPPGKRLSAQERTVLINYLKGIHP